MRYNSPGNYVIIDDITPLSLGLHTDAFIHTPNVSVTMAGVWTPSSPPRWWENRSRFNAGNRFFNAAGQSMVNFFN